MNSLLLAVWIIFSWFGRVLYRGYFPVFLECVYFGLLYPSLIFWTYNEHLYIYRLYSWCLTSFLRDIFYFLYFLAWPPFSLIRFIDVRSRKSRHIINSFQTWRVVSHPLKMMSTYTQWRYGLLLAGDQSYINLIFFDKIKLDFFRIMVVSVLLYGSTTRMLKLRMEEKLDDYYPRMQRAVSNRSRKQQPTIR